VTGASPDRSVGEVDESATGPAGFFMDPRINAEDWATWLDENHETAPEVWLLFWKKASGRQTVDWAQAVEIALRYGWIDGIVYGIDEHRYRQRFTPRRPKSKWSKVNKEIALRLIATGEMRPMGLAAVEAAKACGEWDRAYTVQRPLPAPDDLKAAIKAAGPEAKRTRDRLSRTRWDRWMLWLEGTEGRTRTRRINAIVKALETRDYGPVDKQARPKA
jgi:uncharacterized protein YdeI (YjbR/CyaY-like superfamily)